jgi:hypothetical protein
MRARVLAFAGVAAVLMSATSIAGAETKKEPKTWKDQWTVSGRPSVRVRTGDARVTIHTREGASSTVAAEVREVGSHKGLFVGERNPEVEFTRDGSTIVISARVRGVMGGIMFSDYRLQVDVWVPRESDIDVRTSDGDVTLGPLSGTIQVETSDGNIEALGLRGDLTLRSSDGNIEAGDLDGKLRLRTQDGSGEIAGRFDMLAARSSDGRLNVTATRGSALAEPWSIESSDGRIGLRIPGDLKAYIDARSQDGSLDIDLPISVRGRVHRNELQGELNGGSQVLTLRSSDGSIHVSALN